MSFDWREYLELAKDLAGEPSSGYSKEASQRSAVSRAYYASFCWARDYAEAHWGFSPERTGDDHRLLREHLRKRGMVKMASDLSKLRGWRNACDYENQVPSLHQYTSNSTKLADKIIRQCR